MESWIPGYGMTVSKTPEKLNFIFTKNDSYMERSVLF